MSSSSSTDLDKFIKCDVFTPDHISKLMASKLSSHGTLLEPSVGTGNLLNHLDLTAYDAVHVYELKNDYLKQVPDDSSIIKHNCDFLKADATTNAYDNIILNPPYIKVQDLSIEYRAFLKTRFPMLKSGMVDIYYAFLIKCLEQLSDTGTMVSITPNTYLYNKSALNLRKYLIENRYISEIIDYKSEKMFKGVSVYCCVTVFNKMPKDELIYNGKQLSYDDVAQSPAFSLFEGKSQQPSDSVTLKSVCKISNGIATLRDGIYVHAQKLYDEPCWQVVMNGTTKKFIIYPYIRETKQIIPENQFKNDNPKTYAYLLENKAELMKRDKGNKTYAAWYAYGRTQSLGGSKQRSIYLPSFIHPENISERLNDDEPMLFLGCVCIEPNDVADMERIKNSIIENIESIADVSSKRSGGWITLSTATLYQTPFV